MRSIYLWVCSFTPPPLSQAPANSTQSDTGLSTTSLTDYGKILSDKLEQMDANRGYDGAWIILCHDLDLLRIVLLRDHHAARCNPMITSVVSTWEWCRWCPRLVFLSMATIAAMNLLTYLSIPYVQQFLIKLDARIMRRRQYIHFKAETKYVLTPPPPYGMRCCRSDKPGLCLFCCYQPLCVVMSASNVDLTFFVS